MATVRGLLPVARVAEARRPPRRGLERFTGRLERVAAPELRVLSAGAEDAEDARLRDGLAFARCRRGRGC